MKLRCLLGHDWRVVRSRKEHHTGDVLAEERCHRCGAVRWQV